MGRAHQSSHEVGFAFLHPSYRLEADLSLSCFLQTRSRLPRLPHRIPRPSTPCFPPHPPGQVQHPRSTLAERIPPHHRTDPNDVARPFLFPVPRPRLRLSNLSLSLLHLRTSSRTSHRLHPRRLLLLHRPPRRERRQRLPVSLDRGSRRSRTIPDGCRQPRLSPRRFVGNERPSRPYLDRQDRRRGRASTEREQHREGRCGFVGRRGSRYLEDDGERLVRDWSG